MPFDKLVLILVLVVLAAGLTIWVAAAIQASHAFPVGWAAVVSASLAAYMIVRILGRRLGNRRGAPHDR